MTKPRKLIYATNIALLLTACGGGDGGGSGTAAAPPPATTTAAPVATPAVSFGNVNVDSSFDWKSQQNASTSGITITQSFGANLGNVRVTVSNFIETDPTGSGTAIPALSTDVLTYALGGSTGSPTATIRFGQLALPSGTQEVLIEVFSTADGSRLGGGKLSVKSLLVGSATLTL
jgi:hypothetical protein